MMSFKEWLEQKREFSRKEFFIILVYSSIPFVGLLAVMFSLIIALFHRPYSKNWRFEE